MNINEYTNAIVNALEKRLEDATITVTENIKSGGVVLHGITIRKGDNPISPCFYAEPYHVREVSPEDAAADIEQQYNFTNLPDVDMANVTDWEKAKDSVTVRLVPNNADYLQGKLSFDVLDLKAVFIIELIENGTVTITDNIASGWDVELDEIKRVAIENTKRLAPVKGRSMLEVLAEMMPTEDIGDVPMAVYTNSKKMFGANAMLIGDFGRKPRYILPSSIHEVLSVDAEGADVEQLRQMVREVNDTQVVPEERLSYSVYYWDGNSLSIAE